MELASFFENMVYRALTPEYGQFAAQYIYARYLMDCTAYKYPQILVELQQYSDLDCLYHSVLDFGHIAIKPAFLSQNASIMVMEQIHEVAAEISSQLKEQYSKNRELILSFKDEMIRTECSGPLVSGIPVGEKDIRFDIRVMSRFNRCMQTPLLNPMDQSEHYPSVVRSFLPPNMKDVSTFIEDVYSVLDASLGETRRPHFLVCEKSGGELLKDYLISSPTGLSRVKEIIENDKGLLIKMTNESYYGRASKYLEHLKMSTPEPEKSYIEFTMGNKTKIFDDVRCFSMAPSSYELFESSENDISIKKYSIKQLPKAGSFNGLMLLVGNDMIVSDPEFFQSYTKMHKCLNDKYQHLKAQYVILIEHPSLTKEWFIRVINTILSCRECSIDFIEYWIRHAKLISIDYLSPKIASEMLLGIISQFNNNDSLLNEFQSFKETTPLVKILAFWVLQCERTIDKFGINVEPVVKRIGEMRTADGKQITTRQTRNIIQFLLLTALGLQNISIQVSKSKSYLRTLNLDT